MQNFEMIGGAQRKAVANHHALDVVVEQHRDQRILEAGHRDDIVDELILRTAQLAQALTQVANVFMRAFIDEQHFEVGSFLPGFLVIVGYLITLLELGGDAQVDRL